MSDWLNTRQAAERLGVSEASVRRWGDRGLLPVRRVGGRGDRRFKAAEVDRFRVGLPARTLDRPAATQVVVGGQSVDLHTHLAVFYDSDAGRLRVTAPFLEAGLHAGQPCFLIASGVVLEAYLTRLREAPGLDVDAALRSGRFAIFDDPGTTVKEALEFWERALWKTLEAGPVVVRAVGEMVSERERFASEAEMLAYEVEVASLLKRFPTVCICSYDVREFSGPALFQALRAHPDLYSLPLRTVIS